MSDTEASLLRAVCEAPFDDMPRLVYADWLDENRQGERAEWIRHRLEPGQMPRVFPPGSPVIYQTVKTKQPPSYRSPESLFPELDIATIHVADGIPGVSLAEHRGFISEVTLSLSRLMGSCSGQHRGNGSPGCPREPHHHCDEKCKGLARELARWPLTGVRVSDREPRHAEWSVWTKTPDTSGPYFPMTWHIPQEIFDFLPKTGGVTTGIRRAYPTREDAHAALSHAAVNYVRELAGLRALPRRDPERIFVDMTGRRHVSSIQFATMRAPSRLHGWREEPTGEITVTFTGDVRPFHGHVGKEVYLLVPGETSGPWMVLETEFTLPRFDEGRAVVVRLAGG